MAPTIRNKCSSRITWEKKKIKVRLSSRLKNWGNDGDNDANSVNNLFEVGRVANSKLENGMWNEKEGGGGGGPKKQSLSLKAGKRDLAMFPTTLLVRPYWFTEDQNLTFFLGVILLKMAWTRHVLANIAPNARVKPMDMTQARALT